MCTAQPGHQVSGRTQHNYLRHKRRVKIQNHPHVTCEKLSRADKKRVNVSDMPSQIQSMRQHCFLGTFQSPQNHRQVPWVNHWPGDQNKLTRTIYKARDQRMLTSRQYTELEGAGSNSHQIDLDCGKSSVLNNQILQKRQNGTKQTLESENIPKHSLFKFIKRLLPATTGPGPVGAAKAALAAADIPPPANAWQANAELSKSACDHSPSLWIECEEETAVVCRKFMWRYLKLAPQLPLTHQPL